MAQKSNNKMNISYTIRAIDRFTSTHDRLERQLGSLERQAARLEAINPDIDVDANTAGATRDITTLRARIASLPGMKRIRIWIDEVGDIDKMATKLRNIDEILMQMAQGLIWMVIPMLGPALGIAAAGAGALATELIAAAGAFGAFAMVAVPTIGYLREIDGEVKRGSKEWYNLSEGTRNALTSLDALRSSWGKMQKTFREPTLEIFALGLQGADKALQMFQPTMESSIEAIENLARAFNDNLNSSDVKGIFEWLGNTAGGYLEDLMKTIGNFLVGFMNMIVAFDPLAQQFSDGFLDMSERFREWSQTLDENDAFQRFIAYATEQGPALLNFFGQLITFLTQVFIAMAPVGELVMEMVTNFMAWAEEGLKNNEWIGKLLGYLILWRASLSLILPILNRLIVFLRGLWPVVTKVWTWFGKLNTVFIKILPWITKVGTFILGLNPVIRIIIAVVAVLASVIYKNWDSIWAWTKSTFQKVKTWIQEKWEQIGTIIDKVKKWAQTVEDKVSDMYDSVVEWFGNIWEEVDVTWSDILSFLAGIDLWSIGADIIKGLANGLESVDVWGVVKGVAGKIKDGFTSFFNIHSPSRLMEKDVGRWITLGVLDGMTSMASKAERQAEVVANAIKKPFDTMDKNYTFTAVGDARTAYARSSQADAQTTTTAEQATVVSTQPAPSTAIFSIGGYEARGLITYFKEEMDYSTNRTDTFRGR